MNKATEKVYTATAAFLGLLASAGKSAGAAMVFIASAVDRAREDGKIPTITSGKEWKAQAAMFDAAWAAKVAEALHAGGEGYGETTAGAYASTLRGLILADASTFGPITFSDWNDARATIKAAKKHLGMREKRGNNGKGGRGSDKARKLSPEGSVRARTVQSIVSILGNKDLTDADRLSVLAEVAKVYGASVRKGKAAPVVEGAAE